ncbi:MAG: hypothetical protein ACE5GQ_01895 [Nitrospinales bacterium]
MPQKLTLKKLAEELIREARAPFSAEDFVRRIEKRWNRKIAVSTLDRLKQRLSTHHYLIGMVSEDFLPYRAVLEKIGHIPLAVPLSALEMRQRVFIPGHRLIPFLSHELAEDQLTFLDARGTPIPKLKKSFLLEEVFDFFQYFSERHFPDPTKVNEWSPGKSLLSVTVWDMREAFETFKIKPGDGLLLELVDYDQGIFRVKAFSADEERRCRLKMRSFHVALEESLIRLSGQYDFSSSGLEKQILLAFYSMEESVLNVPVFSLKDFLDFVEKLSVVGCEWGYPRFMPTGKYKRWELSMELAPRKPTGRCGSLDDIFEDLGLPFDCAEFKAILRATIAGTERTMESLVDLLFAGKGELFYNSRQEDIFYDLLRKMMTTIYEESECLEPKVITELREKTVQVKLSLICILKALEANETELTDLPLEILDQIIDLDSFCSETLRFLEDRSIPTDLKIIRDIQVTHKIISPKLASLEEDIFH